MPGRDHPSPPELGDLERLKLIAKAIVSSGDELELAALLRQFHHETGRLPLPPDLLKVMPPGWGFHGVPPYVTAHYRQRSEPLVMDVKTLLVKPEEKP